MRQPRAMGHGSGLDRVLLQKPGTTEKILAVVGVTRQQCQDILGAVRPHDGVLSEWYESESVAAPVESEILRGAGGCVL